MRRTSTPQHRSARPRAGFLLFAALAVLATALPVAAGTGAEAQPRLEELSLEELMEMKVATVYGASLYAQSTSEAPSSITIITSEEIRRFGWRTLGDILGAARSFFLSDDRVYSYLGVRGMQRPGDYNSRVLVLLDGHPTNEDLYGGASFGLDAIVDVALIDRVEVIRGPGSSLYGTGAFFGVVNVITRAGGDVDGVELQGDAGSFGTVQGRASYGRRYASGIEVLLSATRYHSAGEERFHLPAFDDPATNDGVAEDADDEDSGTFFLRISRGGLTLEGAFAERDRTSPAAPYGTVFNTDRTWSEDVRSFLELRYQGEVSERADLSAKLFYDAYRYRGNYLYDYAGEGEPPLLTDNRDHGDGTWLGAESHAVVDAGSHRLTAGVEAARHLRQDQKNYDLDPETGAPDPEAIYLEDERDSWVWGLFLQDELRLGEAFIVTLGARYDRYETFGGTLNPRAALVWTPREATAVKLLYGTAFRAPNVYELYYAAGEQYVQNPELDPERIATYELVVEQKLGSVARLAVGGFHYRITDMIGLVENAEEGTFAYDNTGGLKASGAEVELSGKWPCGLQASASYSYQEVRDDESDEIAPNSPRHLGKARVLAPLLPKQVFLGAEARYRSSRTTVVGGEIGGQTVVNATLSTARGLLGPVELALSAYNLFDASTEDPTAEDFAADRVPGVGRTFLARAVVRF